MESTTDITTLNIKQEETEQDIKIALYQQTNIDSVKQNAKNTDADANFFEQESDYKLEITPTLFQSQTVTEQNDQDQEMCLVHHSDTNTYCLTCNIHLNSILEHTYHMKVFHHIIIPTLNATIEINEPNHQCHLCKISFTNRSKYHKHLDVTHEMNVTLTRRQKPLHTDMIPDTHNPFLYCAPCEKEFRSSLDFSTHLSIVHRMMNSNLEISGDAFECKTCNCILRSKQEYKYHYLRVHRIHITSLVQANILHPDITPDIEDPHFNCAACDNTFNDKITYYMHLFDIHDINPSIQNLDDPEEYYDASQRSLSDDEMLQTTPNRDDVNNHCSSCKFTFPTQSSYYSHLTIIHQFDIALSINEPEIRYPSKLPDKCCPFNYCNICEFTFVRNIDFRNHLARTHDVDSLDREYKPEIIHTVKTPNINNIYLFCNVCEYTFSSKDEYHQHLILVHKLGPLFDRRDIQEQLTQTEPNKPPQPIQSEITTPIPFLENLNFYCKACNQQYTDEPHYQQHLVTNHGLNMPKKLHPAKKTNELNTTKTRRKCCLKCNPLSSNKKFLCREHAVEPYPSSKHSRRITRMRELAVYCKICESKHSSLPAYQHHMKTVHAREKTKNKSGVSCSLCQKKFKNKTSLLYHVTDIHGEASMQTRNSSVNSSSVPDINSSDNHCNPCNKTYKSRLSYGNHLRYKHGIKIPLIGSKRQP